ncbi:MAG TPA: hypothetical protein VFZ09_35690 [Archangium sp.]|uniref:hypothetical protein n=1 Tax=Archangium sp. TaxID=1872627 RepID=UPI002E3584C8|nr:hypothetical protein [Archangium sp.]HEX5751620.1 hypothetical protein [Archangium sp.]
MPITAAIPSLSLHEDHNRALQIIARSLFRELRAHGYTPHHVISLSTELIELVTDGLKGAMPEPGTP